MRITHTDTFLVLSFNEQSLTAVVVKTIHNTLNPVYLALYKVFLATEIGTSRLSPDPDLELKDFWPEKSSDSENALRHHFQ